MKTIVVIVAMIHILIPLLAGAVVYVLWVPTAYVSQIVYKVSGLHPVPGAGSAGTGSFITCFLGDFLWAYSLLFLVALITVHRKRDLIPALILCILFECGTECLQLTPLMSGTFDFCDIAIEILANLLGCMMICFYESVLQLRKKSQNIKRGELYYEKHNHPNRRRTGFHAGACNVKQQLRRYIFPFFQDR